jgi:hypothetical protein
MYGMGLHRGGCLYAGAAAQVTLVTKEQDCRKARDEFNAKLPAGSGRTNRVVVVKAGSTYGY